LDKYSAEAKAARRAERKLAVKKQKKKALKAKKCAINAAMGKKPRRGSRAHGRELAARLKRQPARAIDEHVVVDVKCGSCNATNCTDLPCALNDFQINYTGKTSGTVTTVERAKDILISAATVVTMLAKMGYKITKTFVINTVIATLHSSYSVVEPTINTWLHYREFHAIDTSKTHARLGQGTVILPEHVERFKVEHEERRGVGQRSLRADVISMYKTNFDINVSYDFAGRFFAEIGFTYGPLKAMYTNHPRSPRRLQQLENYILIMDYATKMEKEGKCIIAETDESWAAQNLAHTYGYRDPDDPFTNIPVYHANKMVIIVFKTKEGVLAYVHKKKLDDGTDDFYLQHWDGDFAGVSVDDAAANPTSSTVGSSPTSRRTTWTSSTPAACPCAPASRSPTSPSRKSWSTRSCSTTWRTRRSRWSRSNCTTFPLKIIARLGEVGRRALPGVREGASLKLNSNRSSAKPELAQQKNPATTTKSMIRALVYREMAHNTVCCMYITFVLRKTLTAF